MVRAANFPVVITYLNNQIVNVILYNNQLGQLFSVDANELRRLIVVEGIVVEYIKMFSNGRLAETVSRESIEVRESHTPIFYKTPLYIVNTSYARNSVTVMYFSLKESKLITEEILLNDVKKIFSAKGSQIFMNALIKDDCIIINRMDGGVRTINFNKEPKFDREAYAEKMRQRVEQIKAEEAQNKRVYKEYRVKQPVAVHRVPEYVVGIERFLGGCNTIEIHKNLHLSPKCFMSAVDVSKVKFLEGVTKVDAGAFESSYVLDASFSADVGRIENNAFYDSTLRGNVITNASYIGANAFRETNISTVKLFKVEFIAPRAFDGCDKITKLELGESLVVIDRLAFGYSPLLTELVIPRSTRLIKYGAFENSPNLRVKVPSTTQIEDGAFHSGASIHRYD